MSETIDRRAAEDYADPLATETDWSPIELYGDSADRWLWDSIRTENRSSTPRLVANTMSSRAPTFKRSKSPGNFFLTSANATEADAPQRTVPMDALPNSLEPLRESPADNPPSPPAEASAPTPVDATATSEEPPAQPPAEKPVELVQPVADLKSPPHPRIPKAAGLSLVNPCFCLAVRARGDCDQAGSVRFRRGQKILVYCEVDYPPRQTAQATTEPRLRQFAGSLIIKNRDGRVVHELAYGAGDEATETPESATYVVLPATIPELPPAKYHVYIGLAAIPSGEFAMSADPLSFELVAEPPSAAASR